MTAAEQLAQLFHETYESLAPSYGYETREESARPWAEVPEPNRSLMVAVASRVLDTRLHAFDVLRAHEIGRDDREGVCGETVTAEKRDELATVGVSIGACALRPGHAGLHEDPERYRWKWQDDGQLLIDAAAVAQKYMLGVSGETLRFRP